MGDAKGFLKYSRSKKDYQSPNDRKAHFEEFSIPWSGGKYQQQAGRCMDCGIPFCHDGCPLGNKIPDFNDAVYRGEWREAWQVLKSTNNFPEFTGRICPAPCEASCVLGLNNASVSIEHIEKEIGERAFLEGWETPAEISELTGHKVVVVGSGPAGLAAAEELHKQGHAVTVFERDQAAGGLLRYGIPDFKLGKDIVARRVALMETAGIIFRTGVEIGKDIAAETLEQEFDSVVLCIGSTVPRDLSIEGRDLDGVHFAMDFLKHQNQLLSGEVQEANSEFNAEGKQVLVIGGGDTGADCVGTSNRHGALNVTQIELLDKPPLVRMESNPWPEWPMILTTSTSHEEGAKRNWALLTKRFFGINGKLTGVETVRVEWTDKSKFKYQEVTGSEEIILCDLVLLAIGFSHPENKGLVAHFDLDLDSTGNIKAAGYRTSKEGVFAAGDCRRGQSLVVWAIAEGRRVAVAVNKHLTKSLVRV